MSLDKFELKNLLHEENLKNAYKTFLAQLQPHVPVSSFLGIDFVNDYENRLKFVECFNLNLEKEGVNELIGSDSALGYPISQIQNHLILLHEVDPFLHSLFTLAINSIFCGGSLYAVGGTTSAAIGVVWGNPEKEWKECDYLEFFVHELTHTLMFLDELRFLHYKDQDILHNKENFSLSAILQEERPVDRVLHSIVVATEILMLRSKKHVDHTECRIHPSTDQLAESTQQAIHKLLAHQNKDKILMPRALEIIKVCQDSLAKNFILTSCI